jgi:hypothetical protein
MLGIPRRIEITGTFGYALADTATPSPEIPQEIATACAVIAAVRSGKARKEIIDFSGQRQALTLKTIPKDVMEMLGRFRIALT